MFKKDATLNTIWTMNDKSSDSNWKRGYVFLPLNTTVSNYQLILEASIKNAPSNGGDVSVDDLKITNADACRPTTADCEFKCPDGKCLLDTQVCNFEFDCPNGEEELNCGYNNVTFEDGYKGWNETSNGKFKWQIGNNDIVFNVGPSVGKFIF